MKKPILLFLSLIAVSYSVSAQTEFGLKAGLNYVNNVVLNPPELLHTDSKFRLGYHAGVFVQFGISDKLSLRPELLYASKGAKVDGPSNPQPDTEASLHLNYINIPLLLGEC